MLVNISSSHSNRFISCGSSRNTLAPGTSISKAEILFSFLFDAHCHTKYSWEYHWSFNEIPTMPWIKDRNALSSCDCYMFSSVQVWPHKLTSIDHLCLHVMHSFALIYPFSPRVSRSLFSLSSLQLWMFVQVEWNHQDEKISLHSSFYSLWICGPHSIFCDSISFFLICFSFTVTA